MPNSDDSGEIKPWKMLSSKTVFDHRWLQVRQDAVELPSGKILDDYFILESPHIAVVVPFTKDGQFVLCQQYRYAVDKIMYQFPAGAIDKNETAEQAAKRELMEETGYNCKHLVHLADTASYATKLTGWQHLFLGQDAYFEAAPPHDPTEPIKVVLKTPEELLALIAANEFQTPDSLSAALLALRKLGY